MNALSQKLMVGATVALFGAAMAPGDAAAWSWNDGANAPSNCSPKTSISIDTGKPKIMFQLDRSCSMGSGGKWNQGRNAIKGVVNNLDSDVDFGLGYFSSSASTAVQCVASAYNSINTSLNNTSYGGGTNITSAIQALSAAGCMNQERAAGIVITDGYTSSRQGTLNQACTFKNKSNGPVLFSVGLSSGTDQNWNNRLAAAGGTGSCTDGNAICNGNSFVGSSESRNCSGAFQANDQSQLQTALQNIAYSFANSFPLNTTGTSDGKAHDDPAGTKIILEFNDGTVGEVPHISQSSNGEGWYFIDGATRTDIKFTDFYYNKLQQGLVSGVATHVACECPGEGDFCTPQTSASNQCPVGTKVCVAGEQTCVQVTEVDCPLPCWDVRDQLGKDCNVPGEYGRCSAGITVCCDKPYLGNIDPSKAFPATPYCDEQVSCRSKFYGQPEICNGVDDDCNGAVDDVQNATVESREYTSFNEGQRKDMREWACGYEANACRCTNGIPDAPKNAYLEDSSEARVAKQATDFYNHYNNNNNRCECIAPLDNL